MEGRNASEMAVFNFTVIIPYDFNQAYKENSRLCKKLTCMTYIIPIDIDKVVFHSTFLSFVVPTLHS